MISYLKSEDKGRLDVYTLLNTEKCTLSFDNIDGRIAVDTQHAILNSLLETVT